MDIKDVDILVVPELHYSFSATSPILTISVRAQHDTTYQRQIVFQDLFGVKALR